MRPAEADGGTICQSGALSGIAAQIYFYNLGAAPGKPPWDNGALALAFW